MEENEMKAFGKVVLLMCLTSFVLLAASADELFVNFQGPAEIMFGPVYTYSVDVQGKYTKVAWAVTGGEIVKEWRDGSRYFCDVQWVDHVSDEPAKIKVYGQKKDSDEMFAESLLVTLQAKSRSLDFRSLQNAGGKCLEVVLEDLVKNGGKVQVSACNGSIQQGWKIDESGRLVNGGGKCLDVHLPELTADGGKVQVWDCADVAQQKWTLTDKGALVNEGGKCLDVHLPEFKTDGGKVQIWECVDVVQQQWKLTD
jgi:hypothetical protein